MVVVGALLLPRASEAGILAALARFFGTSPAEVVEQFPVLIPQSRAANTSALDAENRPPLLPGDGDDGGPLSVVEESALLAPLNPVGTVPPPEASSAGQIFLYTVRRGDTLGAIAKLFGVSVNTILWANNFTDPRALVPGEQIVILPVSGVKHEVQKGDTVASLAQKYRGSIEEILRFNGLAPDEKLVVGSFVIIPNGELAGAAPLTSQVTSPFANLPFYEGYYIRPIVGGRRSRGLHGFNGVDLANSCGLPILASADGEVIIARTSGWNGGYGRYVVVAHPNGTQTLYAHMRELMVTAGQAVRQGDVIGSIGSSGNSTGCHVHFEIRGAQNLF